MRVLYIHNSLPEYRVGFFRELNKICDLTIAFTDLSLSQKIYKTQATDANLQMFKSIILKHNIRKDKKSLQGLIYATPYDLIVLPALDDWYHIQISKYVQKIAKQKRIRTGLFWEKWRVSPQKQPLLRRIKESGQSFLIKDILKNINIFWAPGEKTREYLINQGVKENVIYLIHDTSECYGAELLNIRKEYDIPEWMSIVLYFGRLVEYKGADVLIRAFSETSREFQKQHFLLIAGSGEKENEYTSLAEQLKIQNYRFTGFIDPKYRASFFKESDIFILPVKITKGKAEAWGLTVNEAIQYGNIVIATDAVASAYELINEKNGFMVKENNVQELADALMNSCSEKLENTSRLEAEKIKKQYTYETMAQDIVDAFSSKKESRGY